MASLSDGVRVVAREALIHRRLVLISFVLVSVLMTLIGTQWKKVYASSATVLFEQKSIFEPLMQGAAVQPTIADRAKIAREIIYGRTIMEEVARKEAYFEPGMTAADRDLVVEQLRQKTLITSVGDNLIKIEFSDVDPQRAYESARLIADLFIREGLKAGTAESATAVEFVKGQAKEYQEKLAKARAELQQFHDRNAAAEAVSVEALNVRVGELRKQLDESAVQLSEAKIRKASLERQLAGEHPYTTMTQTGDRAGAIALKEAELAKLRLTYQDQYPDIQRLKQELADLRSGGAVALSGSSSVVAANPIYQGLKQELLQSTTLVSTLTARVEETERLLAATVEQSRRAQEVQQQGAELQRRYETMRDVHNDLMRRHETANVSLDMSRQQQGLAVKVVEPAFLPARPKGLGMRHFAAGGIALGLVLPLGFLFWRQQLDERIRDGEELRGGLGTRLVGVIPHLSTPDEAQALARSYRAHAIAGLLTALTIMTIALFWHQTGGM